MEMLNVNQSKDRVQCKHSKCVLAIWTDKCWNASQEDERADVLNVVEVHKCRISCVRSTPDCLWCESLLVYSLEVWLTWWWSISAYFWDHHCFSSPYWCCTIEAILHSIATNFILLVYKIECTWLFDVIIYSHLYWWVCLGLWERPIAMCVCMYVCIWWKTPHTIPIGW